MRPLSLPESLGVAYTTIGQRFSARLHTAASIRDVSGASFFPGPTTSLAALVCGLNRSTVRELASALNPTINFQQGDVRRLPLEPVEGAELIVQRLREAFEAAESANELSHRFVAPQATHWGSAQAWAQAAVDRSEGEPLPAYLPKLEAPTPTAHISFALGVALGRFGAESQGLLREVPSTALPAGILFLSATHRQDSLSHPACAPLLEAWDAHGSSLDSNSVDLGEYLRRDFFAEVHRSMYENRPIYFPLSSHRRRFVALVSIHRWNDDTLQVLLADHLLPERRHLEGELRDLRRARAQAEASPTTEERFSEVQKQLAELGAFIDSAREIAEKGPPPSDAKTPAREVDARFSLSLEDGVMVNSAALWPLLLPQWKDPKKWWKELATAKGRKDHDWSQLSARYFPDRVAAKCQENPSLAAAHQDPKAVEAGKGAVTEPREPSRAQKQELIALGPLFEQTLRKG